MKKEQQDLVRFNSLTEAHELFGLPAPRHPLISLLTGPAANPDLNGPGKGHVLSFYKISYKPRLGGRMKYGQDYYDFNGGGLMFAAPNQVLGHNDGTPNPCILSEFTLLIHPDFLWNYPLAKTIRRYGFFSYTANEALHLSDEEKAIILSLFDMLEKELSSRIDDFSQDVIISQLELLLNYANRFYKRQFITRKVVNHDLLEKMDALLSEQFDNQDASTNGLPTVQQLAEKLNLSPSYLSDMLRSLTGQNAQQHIHSRLIEKAKEKLSTTTLSVSEVAYELGFEYPQSFSKLFKAKTNLSPLEFRKQF